jgi:hypothetical protein
LASEPSPEWERRAGKHLFAYAHDGIGKPTAACRLVRLGCFTASYRGSRVGFRIGVRALAFSDGLAGLAKKIRDTRDSVQTEEATKNAFIMPFISNVLGYDVFDPSEVVPEFTADVGVKKGEKVDYAIFKDGAVQILIECKKIGDPLDLRYASQLFRYFAVTSARIAILTNGQQYHVYTDGDLPNRMDEKPFLVFDVLDIDRTLVPEIQKFSKESFDIESVVNAAEELKYIGGIRRIIATEVKEPSEEWVRLFVSRIYEGRTTQRIVDQFRPLVEKAMSQYIGDHVNSRLKTALGDDAPDPNRSTETPPPRALAAIPSIGHAVIAEAPVDVPGVADPDIVTTEEELEGLQHRPRDRGFRGRTGAHLLQGRQDVHGHPAGQQQQKAHHPSSLERQERQVRHDV